VRPAALFFCLFDWPLVRACWESLHDYTCTLKVGNRTRPNPTTLSLLSSFEELVASSFAVNEHCSAKCTPI